MYIYTGSILLKDRALDILFGNDPEILLFSSCLYNNNKPAQSRHIAITFLLHLLSSQVFALRKKVTHRIPRPGARFYICSLSPDVIVYKGQLTSDQVWTYFADLDVQLKDLFLNLFEFNYDP